MKSILFLFSLLFVGLPSVSVAWPAHLYPNDFDGDGKSDLCVWRPSTGEWYCAPSTGSVIAGWSPVGAGPGSVVQWGLPGDKIATADYDGDRKTDPAVIRPGFMNWYIRKSTGGSIVVQHGLSADLTLTGDHFAGGSDDFAVYRPSNDRIYCRTAVSGVTTWLVNSGVSGTTGSFGYFWANSVHFYKQFGANSLRRIFRSCANGFGNYVDYPLSSAGKLLAGGYLPGDIAYDYAHFLNNTWTIYPGGNGLVPPLVVNFGFGLSNDIPVKGDFDGDNRADLAVYNNGSWKVFSSGYYNGFFPPHMTPTAPPIFTFQWGQPGDIPVE